MAIKDFTALRVSLASPEEIRSWSYGEVTKPETINYRRLRPEKDGLFCEAIFGPTKDYQCYCGKYKKIRYRGITCDKCGVQVVSSRVRRERMGHIELASPVAHIWYTRRVPSYLGLLLNISRRDLDRILYFAQYIITEVDEEARKRTLRHIDEEANREIGRLRGAIQEQIDEIEMRLGEEIGKLEEVGQANRRRLDEELAAITDESMGEAAEAQRELERQMGGHAEVSIAFSQRVIVEKGEEVTRERLPLLTQAVQARLSEIEASIREEQERDQVLIEAEKERLRRVASHQTDELKEKMEREVEAIRKRAEADREEAMSLKLKQLLNESQYRKLEERWGGIFKAGMGAEALRSILERMDLEATAKKLRQRIRTARSKQIRKRETKRLRVIEALRRSDSRPEWMLLTALPVIPPELRPMVQLDGGRFATSDLNDLYRRVINRNNRLKRLLELRAPEVIIRNEKRMLQEAVDSLIDNSARGKAVSFRGGRQLNSLSDILKGKQGRFRRNLLGKRVDYSGRSVIVIGPDLKLHQCGLPKGMALELFKPFVMHKLVELNYAHNIRGAKRIIEQMRPEVWEVLEGVIKGYPVLLNRAPTLHRLGIQAFEPVLVEGDAIQIHPSICAAFNADFDGDQMAVHIPLSEEAKKEARRLMFSTRNLLKPASGEPVVNPTKDIVLGCYYLTLEEEGCRGEGKAFANLDEAALAYELGKVDLHAKIKVYAASWVKRRLGKPRLIETTVGRVLFNQVLPEELRFVNDVMDKERLKDLVADCYYRLGPERTAEMVDAIKGLGFKYATQSGLTIAIDDITIPGAKERILDEATRMVDEIERQYRRGLITAEEQYVKTVELWTEVTDRITDAVAEVLDPMGSIRVMAVSGATKGGFQPVRQLAGMRGLMADPAGRIIPLPIRSNFREGLSALEYFISTHGARKGLADTALRTADAGYLTRRLVDVTQDVIVNEIDCGTKEGILIRREDSERIGEPFAERIFGRIAAAPVVDARTGKTIVDTGEMIDEDQVEKIEAAGIREVYVRSPMTCQLRYGVCAKCYGRDLACGGLVKVGEAVGVIAAQSIGEPGTQLTLRTFHTGGVAVEADITQGLPRVQELFEARKKPKGEAIISEIDGVVEILERDGRRKVRVVAEQVVYDEYPLPGNYRVLVKDDGEVGAGEVLAQRKGRGDIVAARGGNVVLKGKRILIRHTEREQKEYQIPPTVNLLVENGQPVKAGQQLTEGVTNPYHILRILGKEATQMYLLEEIQRVYRSQGVNIHDKHIEMIIRQMLGRVRVTSPGDTGLLLGDLVDRIAFEEINAEVIAEGGQPATAQPVLLGITKAALNTESFLSAASFQHTIKVLAGAAVEGKVDELRGLKENVMVGKLIPAGTGFRAKREVEEAEEEIGVPELTLIEAAS